MARPTKRTPEVEARICDVLKTGNTRRAACDYAGIDQGTFANWLERYSDFSDAVKKAESECEVRNVALIQKAAQETWTAAAWWLERRRSEDWSRKDRLQHEGSIEIIDAAARALDAKLLRPDAAAGAGAVPGEPDAR